MLYDCVMSHCHEKETLKPANYLVIINLIKGYNNLNTGSGIYKYSLKSRYNQILVELVVFDI